MKNIFLLDGLAGVGKSDFLEYIKHNYDQIYSATILTKYTTKPKAEASEDLQPISQEEFTQKIKESSPLNPFFHYEYGFPIDYTKTTTDKNDKQSNFYGFFKSDLDNLLETHENIFVIVRSIRCIKHIQSIYENHRVAIIPTFIYSDEAKTRKRLQDEQSTTDDKIEERILRNESAFRELMIQTSLPYREVIINNAEKINFIRSIHQLLDKYNQPESLNSLFIDSSLQLTPPKALVGYKSEMQHFLNKYPYRQNIFLMIRYRSTNKMLRHYIKKVISDNNFHCVLADELNITHNVYNPMVASLLCKYGIAIFEPPEPSHSFSPNVAYELGLMQILDKTCLVSKHKSLKSISFFDILKDENGQWYQSDVDLLQQIDDHLTVLKNNEFQTFTPTPSPTAIKNLSDTIDPNPNTVP
ncbi:MAG: hypothetical protein FWD76_06370 [Firmicutes bacterium]|nr:hypothetical protein [Bacillota bacterium]